MHTSSWQWNFRKYTLPWTYNERYCQKIVTKIACGTSSAKPTAVTKKADQGLQTRSHCSHCSPDTSGSSLPGFLGARLSYLASPTWRQVFSDCQSLTAPPASQASTEDPSLILSRESSQSLLKDVRLSGFIIQRCENILSHSHWPREDKKVAQQGQVYLSMCQHQHC